MAAVHTTESTPDDFAACTARAMLVPMRKQPKEAVIDQEFIVPSEMSNCIIVSEAQCCIGRRPAGATLTCIVPETWIAMSSCHGFIRWKDGKIIFKDTSSNGTFQGKNHTTQSSFSRLPKGEPKVLEVGDYVMFSQWSNNRTYDELLIYHVQSIPEDVCIKLSKRPSLDVKQVSLKSKTPKRMVKAVPMPVENTGAGSMAPCKHCAKQAADAISARQELASEQHKTSALSKELDSVKKKADVTATEINGLREQLSAHGNLKQKVSQVSKELAESRKAHERLIAEYEQKDEDYKSEMAKLREMAEKSEAQRVTLSQQLEAAQTEVQTINIQLKQAQDKAAAVEQELQSELSKLKEQNRALHVEQEQRENTELTKLKEEHDAEISRLRESQLSLQKEVAAWRLKTETVTQGLPRAVEKSMIPQLKQAARHCVQMLLQDVDKLNDTTPSDLFGGTPTNIENLPGNERPDYAGHPGPSQHTVCFSSPGNLAAVGHDAQKTEMFEGATGDEAGIAATSQEEQGPSVSLRHGIALSQAKAAPHNDSAGQGAKDPASPLLHGFMRSGKDPSLCEPAQNDVEAAVVGMTTDETRVSSLKFDAVGWLPGAKRKMSVLSTADGDADDGDGALKTAKQDQQDGSHEHTASKGADASDQDSMEDRSTAALAERLKAIKDHETLAC